MPTVIPTVAGLPGRWTYLYQEPMRLMADQSGFRSTVVFETDLSNLSDFVLYVGGNSQPVTAGSYSFNRIIPMVHPAYPSLWAAQVECEAFGEASETSEALLDLWSNVKVRVEFRTPPYPTSGGESYMKWDVDQGTIYTTQPGRKLAFPDGEPIDQDAGAFATLNSYTLTLYQCPNLNDTAIDLLGSTYNQDVFRGRPAGSMLFLGCKSNFSTDIGGVTRYTRALAFRFRGYHWNKAYKRNGVLDIPIDPAGNPTYQPGDWSTLFS